MSDDDRDIDIESDDDIDSDTGCQSISQRHANTQNFTQAEKRAHHNALERKRRDHIKESFTSLREAVPSLKGEKASRAQILKKTTECILTMRCKNQDNHRHVENLKKQIAILEEQIHLLQKARNGQAIDSTVYQQLIRGESPLQQDISDCVAQGFSSRSKKLKTSAVHF